MRKKRLAMATLVTLIALISQPGWADGWFCDLIFRKPQFTARSPSALSVDDEISLGLFAERFFEKYFWVEGRPFKTVPSFRRIQWINPIGRTLYVLNEAYQFVHANNANDENADSYEVMIGIQNASGSVVRFFKVQQDPRDIKDIQVAKFSDTQLIFHLRSAGIQYGGRHMSIPGKAYLTAQNWRQEEYFIVNFYPRASQMKGRIEPFLELH